MISQSLPSTFADPPAPPVASPWSSTAIWCTPFQSSMIRSQTFRVFECRGMKISPTASRKSTSLL